MIEPTDEMIAILDRAAGREHSRDGKVVAALQEILAVAERQWQEQYGDAYQRGWWRGQHQLCPRCGVELEREVAAERGRPADPFGPIVDPCTDCGCAKAWHGPKGCTGDFTCCPCETWMPLDGAP